MAGVIHDLLTKVCKVRFLPDDYYVMTKDRVLIIIIIQKKADSDSVDLSTKTKSQALHPLSICIHTPQHTPQSLLLENLSCIPLDSRLFSFLSINFLFKKNLNSLN